MLVAQNFHEAAVETAAAEDVVAGNEGVIVGVVAFDEGGAEQDLCLCAGKGDVAALGGLFGNGRDGVGCGGFDRQVFEDALDQLLCLFAVEVADDGDDGVVFAVVGAVEGADVVQTNAFEAVNGYVCAAAVGMVRVDELGQFARGGVVGGGFLLLQAGNGLDLTAAENGFVKARTGQRVVEQVGSFVADVGFAEAAEACGCAFGITVAADVRTDVVGFGIEGFFVQLLGAVGQEGGGKFGNLAFAVRIGDAACALKADFKVDDGVFVAFDKEDLGAVAVAPALDVGGGLDA